MPMKKFQTEVEMYSRGQNVWLYLIGIVFWSFLVARFGNKLTIGFSVYPNYASSGSELSHISAAYALFSAAPPATISPEACYFATQ